MKFEISETGPNEKEILLTIETVDIGPKIKSELNKIRAKTDIKGFRKGKTPMSFVKRHYGKRVAMEVIADVSQEKLSELIAEQNFDLINQPVLTKSTIPALEDGGLDEDCTFNYLIGLMPDIELSGVSSDDSYDYYELDVADEKVSEQLEKMQKQFGSHTHPDDIVETDIVEVDVEELQDGDIKEDGHDSNFRFAVDLVADEELKNKILNLSPDATFDFDIYNLERDRNDEYVHRYFLKLKEEESPDAIGKEFRATIAKVHRHVPANLDEEFFNAAFQGEIDTEQVAREEIKKQFVKGYAAVGDNILLKKVIETITENNSFELPSKYVHELMHPNAQHEHTHTEEETTAMHDSVRRQIIISKLVNKLNVQIEQDDLRNKVMEEFAANFGGASLPPETIDKIVTNALQDEKYSRELSDRVLNDKLIAAVKESVSLNRIKMEEEALMTLYDETFPKPESDEEE